ncbi:VCBS repeat-containing protein [Microbacterium bovistercoris]|uniref:VCBS repeat-containing protein n=1 Tax=Microbacterium bovistercoris TaxID=2293570 RepID=A0A371NSW0_9MICO|nr:VCBS repeat-containing protein [Microbacterium bovistercoris]REJ04847.1 VCBS repeat-containing protein [Microbacterium bovistercoris]
MMFTRNKRRGLGVAATCAAVAMAAGMATPAFAAGTADEPMVLTPEQAEQLSAALSADVYRDAAAATQDAPAEGDAETETSDGGNTLQTETEAAAWKLTQRAAAEGDYGMVQTVPVAGAGDDYFAIDSLGLVQRRTAGGSEVWKRDNTSWYAEWGVKPVRPWQAEPYPARIVVGYNAVSPFGPASENGFATGDLTGDGVADLVFSAEVGSNPYRPMVGTPSTGTFVTIVDGADGRTLWHKLYAAVYGLSLVDGTLVLADSPYVNINSPAGSTLTLRGLTFAESGDGLKTESEWTYDPAAPKASSWADLEPIGDGLLAVAWDRRKDALATVPSGNTLVIDTADGSVKWTATDRLYSRQLHLDASRDRLVALEQSDPNEGVQYQVVAYALADGARSVLDTRVNAMPLAAAVGDLGDGGRSEIVVSETTLDGPTTFNASTVRGLDGDSAAQRWSYTTKRDAESTGNGPLVWGTTIVGGRVVLNIRDDAKSETGENRSGTWFGRITALAGNNGAVKWEHTGTAASQLWSQVLVSRKDVRVRTVDTLQNVRTYNVGSGKQTAITPLPADSSSAVTTDVNGDGIDDLVVGGNSFGLFAYDGPSLVAGKKVLIWTATLPGSVQKTVLADVNGDGRDEIVVAADTAAVVIDAATGKTIRTIDGSGEFVRTLGTPDLDDDGKAEIVLSTDSVQAYHADGKLAWRYKPQDGVVFGDVSFDGDRVYAEYASRGSLGLPASEIALGAVALKARDGAVVWRETPTVPEGLGLDGTVYGATQRAATFASPEIPYADGHAVVYTWLSRPTPALPPAMFMEIRDGRSGEVLHSARLGGPHNLGGWFTGPEGLMAVTTGAITTFGAEGDDTIMRTVPTLVDAGFATAPSGERIVVAGSEGGLSSWPASNLTVNSPGFLPSVASINAIAARELALGDLDGDGRVEAVSLNYNARGTDRAAGLFGSAYSTPFTAMRKFIVVSVDAP